MAGAGDSVEGGEIISDALEFNSLMGLVWEMRVCAAKNRLELIWT